MSNRHYSYLTGFTGFSGFILFFSFRKKEKTLSTYGDKLIFEAISTTIPLLSLISDLINSD
jgi:hypothetical protein